MVRIADNDRIEQHRSVLERLKAGDELLLVGIDVAKDKHVASISTSGASRGRNSRATKVVFYNHHEGFTSLRERIEELRCNGELDVVCGLEPTGNYHKPLANWLEEQGYTVVLISGYVSKANRITLDATWDANDVKDSLNVLDIMRQGKIQYLAASNDYHAGLRVLIKSQHQLAKDLAKLRARLRSNVLAIWFPEVEKLFKANILHDDFLKMLSLYPTPEDIRSEDPQKFVSRVISGRSRVRREKKMLEVHGLACTTIGCTASDAGRHYIRMLINQIGTCMDQLDLATKRLQQACKASEGYLLLQSIPGVGPKLSAVILAHVGDPRSFQNLRQVRKLAGLNLCSKLSGKHDQGSTVISHGGKGILRWSLYTAVTVAIAKNDVWKAMYEHELRKRGGKARKGAKKQSQVKLMDKMLRVAFAVLRDRIPYDESTVEQSL